MIDNVYELKQRFVGFNKVKLLTVVFYCMTYSWCSFLNEYNAMELKSEEEKGKWRVEGDAVVYTDGLVKITYRWNKNFIRFIDGTDQNNNIFPVRCESATRFVEFLCRYQGTLGIKVKEKVEYRKPDLKDLPGCCTFCCNDKLENGTLLLRNKENGLVERICSIDFGKGICHNDARKKWMGDINAIKIDDLDADKMALLVIANLFNQKKVDDGGEERLLLSDSVNGLIKEKLGCEDVSLDYYMPLQSVICVNRENNDSYFSKNFSS